MLKKRAKQHTERFVKIMRSTLKNRDYDIDTMTEEEVYDAYCRHRANAIKENFASRGGHSEETKRKIAAGNTGKAFTVKRCKAISEARTLTPSDEQLTKLRELWTLRHLNPKMVKKLAGIKTNAVFQRYCVEYCDVPQTKFMPSDMTPEELSQLLSMAGERIHYHTIADILGRGRKCIRGCLTRMGVEVTTNDGFDSELEKDVFDALKLENIVLHPQFQLQRYFYDFRVGETNILIEVNGDYWHCNPVKYINGPINERQRLGIVRDDEKRRLAKSSGYQLITIWERDWKYDRLGVIMRMKNVCMSL